MFAFPYSYGGNSLGESLMYSNCLVNNVHGSCYSHSRANIASACVWSNGIPNINFLKSKNQKDNFMGLF